MQRLHHSTHAQAQWGHESENERQMGHTAHSDNTRHADAAPRQRAGPRSDRGGQFHSPSHLCQE